MYNLYITYENQYFYKYRKYCTNGVDTYNHIYHSAIMMLSILCYNPYLVKCLMKEAWLFSSCLSPKLFPCIVINKLTTTINITFITVEKILLNNIICVSSIKFIGLSEITLNCMLSWKPSSYSTRFSWQQRISVS